MSAILSAILWFVLGGLCTVVGFLGWVTKQIHENPKLRETFTDPKNNNEVADMLEDFFYGKKN